jgi:hypothetical protein
MCVLINPLKKIDECGAKFKSKDGYCTSKSKELFGGFCGLHKSINNNCNKKNVIVV